MIKYYYKKLIKLIFIVNIILLTSCGRNEYSYQPYIDPHIIFSSIRWWNYDIFSADIFGENVSHITKNEWLDFDPAVSSDGSMISFISDRSGNRDIFLIELLWIDGYQKWEAKNLQNISNSPGHEWNPKFSPDNDKIIYSYYDAEKDNYDIYIYDIIEKKHFNLTNRLGYELYPQFSPDGSYVIFQSWQNGVKEIFFINILEKNEINISKNSTSNDILPISNAITPDGQRMVFTSERDGNMNIYSMNINGLDQKKLTSHDSNDYEPTISNDGQRIVFTSEREGNKDIFIMDFDGENLRQLTTDPSDDWNPKFYPDSRKIVFQSTRDNNWEIYKMNLDGTSQKNITNNPTTDFSFTILPLNQ